MNKLYQRLEWLKTKKWAKWGATAILVGLATYGGYAVLQYEGAKEHLTAMALTQDQEVEMYNTIEVRLFDEIIGEVPDMDSAYLLADQAYNLLTDEIGYDPELEYELDMYRMTSVEYAVTEEAIVVENIRAGLYNSIDNPLVKAYVMMIGDDFTVAIDSVEALTEVLKGAQSLYVNDDSGISVSFTRDAHNSLVLVPQVTVLSKELSEERVFVTADMLSQITGSGEEISGDGSDAPMEDLEAEASEFVESVVKDVVLEQSVVIVESFVNPEDIKSIQDATVLITKENEKEKIYEIEEGDCPSVIAVENGMSTTDLYSMNPGLEENASKMQIGDDLVIMVPEPELFVTTIEDVIYMEVIDRATLYVNTEDEYVGTNSVITEGSDGILEVRATISKVNGKETDRVITEETALLASKPAKILRGIKALPVTTATGTFDMPLISYYFSSGFGPRWGRMHTGIDLAAPTGTNVRAADGGRIIEAGWHGSYGYMVQIDHGNGFTSIYGHNSQIYVSIGDEVAKYQTIAAVGSTGNSTGPHCHFEIRKNNVAVNPMNYLK